MRQQVYVLSAGEYVKIGVSAEPKKRVKEIQTGCPLPVKLEATIETGLPLETEVLVHEELKDCRACGEWFRLETAIAIETVERISGIIASTFRGQQKAVRLLGKYKKFQTRRLKSARGLLPQ